jgi:probable HAF family extracellular repeat protein
MAMLNMVATFARTLMTSHKGWYVVIVSALLGCSVAFQGNVVHAALPSARIKYDAIDLGVYPGDGYSTAADINLFEQIVGVSGAVDYSHLHAVLWAHGAVKDLGTLSAPFNLGAEATGINDFGQVTGNSFGPLDNQAQPTSHAFVWRQGDITDLGSLGGPNSHATAINDRGQIVGWSETNQTYTVVHLGQTYTFNVRHAFLWEHGVMADLGTLGCPFECPRNDFSQAVDIDINGNVVGITENVSNGPMTGFIWQNGIMRALLGFASGDQVEVSAINNFGQIVGIDDTSSDANILWNRRTVATPLNCPGLGFVVDINDLGFVIGGSQNPSNDMFYGPTLCMKGQVIFLPPVGPQSGDNFPARMNDLAEIVGKANLTQGTFPDDLTYVATHAVLWRPSLIQR